MRLHYSKKCIESITNNRNQIFHCYHNRIKCVVAIISIFLILSGSISSIRLVSDLNIFPKMPQEANAQSTSSTPSILFSSNFSNFSSTPPPMPNKQNIFCGNIQIAKSLSTNNSNSSISPAQTQQNNTFIWAITYGAAIQIPTPQSFLNL